MENEIIKTDKGYIVENNAENVIYAFDKIVVALDETSIPDVDVLTALCLSSIEFAINAKIEKQQMLSFISNMWEHVEGQEN